MLKGRLTHMAFAFRSLPFGAGLPWRCRPLRANSAPPTSIRPTIRRGGRHVHGQAAQRADRRPDRREVYPQRRAGQREGHDRAAADRRARHDPHQRGAAEQLVPETIVPGCRSCSAPPSTCARCSTGRSATTSWLPWRPGPDRPRLLRRGARSITRRSRSRRGRHPGHEDPCAPVRPFRGDGGGAGRQPDADALSARCIPR